MTELTTHANISLMTALREGFTAFEGAPSDNEVTKVHDLLIDSRSFFIDKEMLILLTPSEASWILRNYRKTNDSGGHPITLGRLISQKKIREWSNVAGYEIISNQKISLLSVFEYILKQDGGIVESQGLFPSGRNQVALQKDVLGRILAQVPDWQTRFLRSTATLMGPIPPGVGV